MNALEEALQTKAPSRARTSRKERNRSGPESPSWPGGISRSGIFQRSCAKHWNQRIA